MSKTKPKDWKCERCGKCCKYVTFNAELTEDQRKWMNAHIGITVSNNNVVIIRSKCVFLKHSGRLYRCALHETGFKPDMCKNAGEKNCVRHNRGYK